MTSALINQRQDVEKYASFCNLILEKWKQDWTQNGPRIVINTCKL